MRTPSVELTVSLVPPIRWVLLDTLIPRFVATTLVCAVGLRSPSPVTIYPSMWAFVTFHVTVHKLTEGNNSGAAKEAAAAAKANGSKGKGKSGGGDKGKKKSVPSESLSELALACLEECVLIAAYSHPHVRTAASRTAKVLAVSFMCY